MTLVIHCYDRGQLQGVGLVRSVLDLMGSESERKNTTGVEDAPDARGMADDGVVIA